MTRLGLYGWILSAILIVVIFFMRSCAPKPEVQVKTIPGDKEFVTVTKPVYKDSIVYQRTPGKTHYSHDTAYIHDTTYLTKHDTLKAATACLDPYVEKDSSVINEVQIYRYDSLYMNRFAKHVIRIKNNRTKQVVASEKFKMYAGGQIGLSLSLKSAIVSPSIMFQTKTDQVYQISYDIISRTPEIGTYWKIHF